MSGAYVMHGRDMCTGIRFENWKETTICTKQKTGTMTEHGRIQPNIPTHFRDTETSLQHVTLTYL